MSIKKTIIGNALLNIPWEDKPAGCKDIIWRSAKNPIIRRDHIPSSNSIFNSAVVPFKGKFAGVFRCDDKTRRMIIHRGFSDDGVKWNIDHKPIEFKTDIDETGFGKKFVYGYDPRVVFIEDRYWVTWCNFFHGPTIGVAYTFDFEEFHQIENAYLPFNRNGVLFPRKINDKYVMLSRPSDNGHTPFGEIFISQSPDMVYWGEHRHVMAPLQSWEHLKIGAGPIPIETTEGWLLIYHGVLLSCNGYVYSMSAAILDIDEPWKVKYRCKSYLLNPRELYEMVGDVPNVTFPCASLQDAETGRITIYYGAADTVTCLAYTQVDELIDYIKNNSVVSK
ncbi:MAG: glycoside hydrolase family 130 protein [Calditrichaceae bacterium]|nr:glycoside hydrolase family 130 protein [Calditrichaceae bacterium]MBN2708516.1 glycoside hydrolase family 130 protein [Calditrichaceae bacterium]RQV95439.1 MAG: glycosidase [Calditrichota bacterium]